MNGEGCRTCPVKNCDTSTYRGSRCASLRHSAGIYMDPQTNLESLKQVLNQMTSDQMAKFIVEYRWVCEDCPEHGVPKCTGKCVMHCKEWLELPEDPGVEVSS